MTNRNSPARGCCGCSNGIRVLQGCSPFGPMPAVPVAVYAPGGGSPIASGATDGLGVFATDLDAGAYELRIRPGAANEARRAVVLACGSTTDVAYFGRPVQFSVTGCGGNAVAGAEVAIGGGDPRTLTTNASGVATWYPQAAGAYTYTVTRPGGRWGSASGSGTVANLCTVFGTTPVTLPVAAGFSCCDWNTWYPAGGGSAVQFKQPRGPIKVVTSAGDEWTFTGCSSKRCTYSETVLTGAQTSIFDPIPPLSDGTVPLHLEFGVSGTGVICPWYVRTIYTRGSHGNPGQQWFTSFACSDSMANSSPQAFGTLNSMDPLSVTWNFPDASNASYSWTWPNPAPPIPTPLKWITLTELL